MGFGCLKKMTLFACVAASGRRLLGTRGFTPTALASSPISALRRAFVSGGHLPCSSDASITKALVGRSGIAMVPGMPNWKESTCTGLRSATTSAVSSTDVNFEAEVQHPAYDIVTRDVVNEYGYYTTLYRHKKSGAELLSVATDDDNKVFGITFRTPPADSTGVPHILEHSVLCGSRKYTTKDPFVQLLQGSLQTFLNAFTYPDRTCYVVASQNTKDFYNLINVYTDAVFHPRAVADPNVHAQEGWHLELEDKSEPLKYKGVVYNEMKGVYSSPDSLLNRESQRSLFPDNTYSVDSGGDPRVIPQLSFEQFRDFHAKYYHPANSRIYFSGDDDLLKRLEIMDEYLSDFDDSPSSKAGSVVQWQTKRFTEPVREKHYYPSGGGGDEPSEQQQQKQQTHMMNVNWLLNDKPLTSYDDLTFSIMDHLLMGTSSSILKKTLMESGLGAAVTGGGLSDELLQATFSVGLKGIHAENVNKVEQLIMDTLRRVAEEGFSVDAIAASMNTVEFDLREFNTGSFPKGLAFMLGSMSKWVYDKSPTDGLKFEEPLAQLKSEIAANGSMVFQKAIKELLVDNTHRTITEMMPSKTLEAELVKEEEDRLAALKSAMKDDELNQVILSTNALKKLQATDDSPADMATIPKLALADLKREVTEYPIEILENEADSGVTVVRHELASTSGIAYVDFGVDLSILDLSEVPLIPLFSKLLKEAGAGEYDSVALAHRIGTYTGGIDVSLVNTVVHPTGVDQSECLDGKKMQTKLFLRGKATPEKVDELFSIMKLMLTDARLDSKAKVIEMLKESKARMESSIQGSGHSYANIRLKARYYPSSYISEKLQGITYLSSVKELLTEAEEDWPKLLGRLQTVRDKILNPKVCRSGMVINLTGDGKVFSAIQPSLVEFLGGLPGDSKGEIMQDFLSDDHPWIIQAREEMEKASQIEDEGFIVPTQVSYVGKGGKIYESGEQVNGSASVVSRFLRTGYLWDHVRVIGGAYGGFCTFAPDVGFFSFLSYRDPNLGKTIDVYDATAAELLKSADDMANNQEALETAIIGTVGDMDNVLSPDQKGWTSLQRWLSGENAEQRQRWRDEVLNTKPEDFKLFAERLKNMKSPSVAVISSKAAFETAAKEGKEMKLVEVL
jgi:Zn-dependent M16 (insulinase) family peptidase